MAAPKLTVASGLPDATRHLIAALWLHELDQDHTAAQPPDPTATYTAATSSPDPARGLQHAARACLDTWPDLEGLLGGLHFEQATPHTVRELTRAVTTATRLLRTDLTRIPDAYQALRHRHDTARAGAFFTPIDLAELLAEINAPQPGDWVADLAGCGAGTLLLAALRRTRRVHGPDLAASLTLLGIDLAPTACALARAQLLLHGAHPDQFHIACGDGLHDRLIGRDRDSGQLREIVPDRHLANPPFGTKVATRPARAPQGLEIPQRVLYRPIAARTPHPA
ncbi:N-6 DNA methylase [Conexibacter sp. W3-3-2]|uniref:HsdM family class I SAM-dependent methyltransferase n=1 Tax=Conexibacter sp. W3-3-2 TaxID=2675227 RepID=UPI0013251FE1|nr:N-6 DNA methylase [Conexibacter sp. W3-3-2]